MLAVGVMTAMYAGLCFSIAEMSAALLHAGGAYSFARTAAGPWGGYITGLAENMEYVLTPAVIVLGVDGYLGSIFGVSTAVRHPAGVGDAGGERGIRRVFAVIARAGEAACLKN
jgi:amino acid transporter